MFFMELAGAYILGILSALALLIWLSNDEMLVNNDQSFNRVRACPRCAALHDSTTEIDATGHPL